MLKSLVRHCDKSHSATLNVLVRRRGSDASWQLMKSFSAPPRLPWMIASARHYDWQTGSLNAAHVTSILNLSMHVWNAQNTVFGSTRSAICAQAVHSLHSTRPSVTCLRLSDVSDICRVTYLPFPTYVCFSFTSVNQAAQRRTWFTQYRTLDVAENLGRFLARIVHLTEMISIWFYGKNGN